MVLPGHHRMTLTGWLDSKKIGRHNDTGMSKLFSLQGASPKVGSLKKYLRGLL